MNVRETVRRSVGFRAIAKSLKHGWLVLLMLIVVAIPAVPSYGQAQNTGTVSGNVTDAQGGLVTNATAVLTDISRGTASKVAINAKGEFLFTDVGVGTYSLTLTAPTFESYVVKSVQVDADQNVRVDAVLKIGSANESVTVDAPSATIDTRSATIGMMIDRQLVENLPIDGENVVSLAALLPGVSNVNAPTTFTSDTGGPTYNVSGSRANQNLFLLDGSFWNNVYYNTGLAYPPPYALQEVSVQLNNYKAQYGRNVGSVFNVLTRSGSNLIHGTLWEHLQNSALDATDYITKLNPHLVENQFGATVGGPIKRDKAFFFLAFQDLRLAGQVVAQTQTPTLEQRGLLAPGVPRPCSTAYFAQMGYTCASFLADFYPASSAPPPGSNLPNTQVHNPLYSSTYGTTAIAQLNSTYAQQGGTGTSPCVQTLMNIELQPNPQNANKAYGTEYMPNGELPSVCFNPVAVAFYSKYLPLPNRASINGADPEAVSTAKQPRNEMDGLARIDLSLGRHSIDARYYQTAASDLTANSVSKGTGIATYEPDANWSGITFGSIGDTWVVKPNLLNVLRLGYKRYPYTIYPTDPTTLQTLGSNLTVPAVVPALPRLEATNRFTLGSTNSGYSYTLNANFELNESISWTHGNHNVQGGMQYLDMQYIHRYDQLPFIESEQQNTEDSVGDFLLGLIYTETVGNSTNISALQHAFYFYAQDDWRATPRLTVNYGLRYELPFQWYQPDKQSLTFKPGFQSILFPTAPSSTAYVGDPGINKSIVPTRFDGFAPRVGFSYDMFGNGKLALRGGFGIFYDNINASIVGVGEPYHYTAQYATPNGGLSNPLLGQAPIPANYVKGNPQFAQPYTVNFADANLTTPYVEAVNIGFQEKVGAGTLEMNYVGKFGRHQIVQIDLNPAIYDCTGAAFRSNPITYCADASTSASSYVARVLYPGYNYGGQGIVDNASIGTSNYNGLQIIFTQRAKKALSMVASYTYSRSLDIQSNGQTTASAVPQPSNLSSQYGPSDFQATHVLNMGWVWRLPHATQGPAVMQQILNGWMFGGIYNAHTGNPLNVYLAGDASLTDERPQRPNLVPGQNPNLPSNRHRTAKVAEWFNIAAFSTPPNGTFGNVGRNSLYGPAYILTNFSLERYFQLPKEGERLEFRADAFNAFNTPNLGNPGLQLASATTNQGNFGVIQSTVGSNGVVGTNGRRLQISLIFHY